MISILNSFGSSDGQIFKTLEEAQAHEIFLTFGAIKDSDKPLIEVLCAELVQNSEKVLDILTMKPNSRPKLRKVNGHIRKKRTPKGSLGLPLVVPALPNATHVDGIPIIGGLPT